MLADPSRRQHPLSVPLPQLISPTQLPLDIRGGIHPNLISPDTITFVMRAPFKPFVSLVGDFNDWNARANVMQTDGNGTWWTTIRHPGATRYGYYVAVDESAHVWVGDPYATQVLWEDDDEPWAYLPIKSETFCWSDSNWQTPPARELVIYELCVRDFVGLWRGNRPDYGNFTRMLERLDYLAELGINAIELMPIQEFPGASSWGYNPVFYCAVERTYGTPDDFKRFVGACHARGIAVLLDVAFNHAWGDHPYYQIYPPLYGPHGEQADLWNPFFHHTPRAVNMWGGVDWDHFNPETTRYFQDIVRFWLDEYHVDGFRFDWVCGVDYDHNDPMRPGFNPFHGISAICWAARQTKPDCVLIGEFWQLEGTHPEKTAAKLVAETAMDAIWNGEFHHTLDDVLNQRWAWEQRDIFFTIGGYREQGFGDATQVINFSCSHDEVRPEHEIKVYSAAHITRPPGMSVAELALAKARLGLITLFAAPGIPMIYAGQEFGEDTPRTIDFLPLNWEKLGKTEHATYHTMVQRLIAARRTHTALRSDHIDFYADDFEQEQVVRFRRKADESGEIVMVALNFGAEQRMVTLDFPTDGAWYDVANDVVHDIVGGQLSITLQPWSGALLVP